MRLAHGQVDLEAQRAQPRLHAAAQLLPVLQRARRVESQAPRHRAGGHVGLRRGLGGQLGLQQRHQLRQQL
jgi:hypothetical protein